MISNNTLIVLMCLFYASIGFGVVHYGVPYQIYINKHWHYLKHTRAHRKPYKIQDRLPIYLVGGRG